MRTHFSSSKMCATYNYAVAIGELGGTLFGKRDTIGLLQASPGSTLTFNLSNSPPESPRVHEVRPYYE